MLEVLTEPPPLTARDLDALGSWFAAFVSRDRIGLDTLVRLAEVDVRRATGCSRVELAAATDGDGSGRLGVIGRWMDYCLNERRKRWEAR